MIVMNELGYLPGAKKVAVMTEPARQFYIQNQSGETVYEGTPVYFGFDESSGDELWQMDFSLLKEEGIYQLVTELPRRTSEQFVISQSAYDMLMVDLLRAFYYQRCGMELTKSYAGKFVHCACHTGIAMEWGNEAHTLDLTGGWHDAGDYGRYVTAASCALGHLLYAYMLYPDVLDLWQNIPEHDNTVPDILSECRYELEWMMKMQREDGGVYHKATTFHHAPFIMPEFDQAQMYAFPVSSMATADFAAVMALAYRIYRTYDEIFAKQMLSQAIAAAKWLEANPSMIGFENPHGCNTGGYGEREDCDNRLWAWCELYQATGAINYQKHMLWEFYHREKRERPYSLSELGYASVGGFASLAMLTGTIHESEENGRMEELFEMRRIMRKEVLYSANKQLESIRLCGYRVPMRKGEYYWGSNMVVLKHGMVLALAYHLTEDDAYIEGAADALHYLLGCNALDLSYVTGNGINAYRHPHLRTDVADGIEECIPGMVSGGPNQKPADDTAIRMIPEGTPSMKSYIDRMECYSLNEVTIYWNSPAVYVLAAVLQKEWNRSHN